jgi:hypothetical protein
MLSMQIGNQYTARYKVKLSCAKSGWLICKNKIHSIEISGECGFSSFASIFVYNTCIKLQNETSRNRLGRARHMAGFHIH